MIETCAGKGIGCTAFTYITEYCFRLKKKLR